MDVNQAIDWLIAYARREGLLEEGEETWGVNALLEALGLDSYAPPEEPPAEASLPEVLKTLLDDAHARGVLPVDSVVYRDLLDTRLMGALTPRPGQVRRRFRELYAQSPQDATSWYYHFSQAVNYIRADRIARDIQWKTPTRYGELDITINLSKPEKDPRAIAAARELPASDYPRCQLCAENEGYAGRVNHPARQNLRVIPLTLQGEPWFFQYSPYVYYNEHCIVFNRVHTPMKIERATFDRLLDFVGQFPHYFIGSNADLPIVGGSILAHDHFQGGRYDFAMAKAPVEEPVEFPGFGDVQAGMVRWPMAVVRLRGGEPGRLAQLADRILRSWRGYSDPAAMILAETGGEPHNTITPIARRRGEDYELDLVLRNNLTTPEYPLGLYHPHSELHHIKKENIGLIEVMGLAVLPARLREELAAVARGLGEGADLAADPRTASHAAWAEGFRARYDITPENALEIVKQETGMAFAQVLEHAGVFKTTPEGREAFRRFLRQVK